ncbi:DUF503 domain-containing protein [Desulfobacterota bacterium AH_259_B03_O07]|nr:DUF503 domain-containing protein [Desulfobacterota bacterium AH_259_B03_O07]
MVIGVLKIQLYMDGTRSLKEKRHILKRIIQRTKSRYTNVSISEVDSQNLWQSAIIGISIVSNEKPYVNSILDRVSGFIESTGLVHMGNRELEIFHF